MTEFRRLAIPDVVEVIPPKFGDDRGFFSEVYKRSAFEAEGIHINWIQENHSYSALSGTMRGCHFQAPPMAQDKLIRVISGAIHDVAIDVRKGSSTYGKWVSCHLSAVKWNQLLVPRGFAHGFMTLMPDTQVVYQVSAPYSKDHEWTIRWDDPELGIDWPVGETVTLVDRDRHASPLSVTGSPFDYPG